ncbi:ABC transporter ATP-binding protein, partial [Streptomyces sp. SID14478]|nr:ABC transporter ATP-binding protein [Streptomyces sp. SID14478]
RCARADDTCTTRRPGFKAVAPDAGADATHRAACWHPHTLQETSA